MIYRPIGKISHIGCQAVRVVDSKRAVSSITPIDRCARRLGDIMLGGAHVVAEHERSMLFQAMSLVYWARAYDVS